MFKPEIKRIALIAALAVVSTVAQAESRLSASTGAGNISATAKISVNVTVPRILYLRVGSAGAQQDAINFAVGAAGLTGTLPINDSVYAGAVPMGAGTVTVTDTETANAQGTVTAQLWTNTGTAALSCTSTNIAAGAVSLPKSDFKVLTTGALAHPGNDLGCGGAPTTVTPASGAGSFTGTWAYSYTPTTLPAAGTYAGVVTYTAVQP